MLSQRGVVTGLILGMTKDVLDVFNDELDCVVL